MARTRLGSGFLAVTLGILSGCASVPRTAPLAPAEIGAPASAPPASPQKAPALPATARGGAVAPPAPTLEPIRVVARVTLAAVGDVLMHGAVKQSAAAHAADAGDAGYDWLFAPVADLLSGADLTFANLETPIAPTASKGSRAFVFNAPPVVVTALQHAGVRLVSVANNHAFDQGRARVRGDAPLARRGGDGLRRRRAGATRRRPAPPRAQRPLARLPRLHLRPEPGPGNACPPREGRGAARCLQAAEIDRQIAWSRTCGPRLPARTRSWSRSTGAWSTSSSRARPRWSWRTGWPTPGALVVLGHHPHVLQPVELYRRAGRPHGGDRLLAGELRLQPVAPLRPRRHPRRGGRHPRRGAAPGCAGPPGLRPRRGAGRGRRRRLPAALDRERHRPRSTAGRSRGGVQPSGWWPSTGPWPRCAPSCRRCPTRCPRKTRWNAG